MGKNRVFRNITTTDASRLTFYKKSIEQFKFARNKPVSKPTDNFTIDYATDEITRFQTYDQFRSLATGFYATRLGTDCSLNKTAPLSISDGKTGSISYQDLIEYHEDPFYTEAAQVFDIQMTVDACKYGKGTLYPYGEYEQKPTTNQFSFPSKVSVATCNSSLTYSDAIGAIGMRSTRSGIDISNIIGVDMDDYQTTTVETHTGAFNIEDMDDFDEKPRLVSTLGIASVSASASESSRAPTGTTAISRNLRNTEPPEPIENSTSLTANTYVYPRPSRFIEFNQAGSVETNTPVIPVENQAETTSYAVFPRLNKQSTIPDGFINVQGEIRPFRYRSPFSDVRDKVPGALGETACDLPDGRIVNRERFESNSGISAVPTATRAANIRRANIPSLTRSTHINTASAKTIPNFPPNPKLGKTPTPTSTSIPTPTPIPSTIRATPMSTIINTKSRGCSKCRG